MDNLYIVSFDIFQHYVQRKDIEERYMEFSCTEGLQIKDRLRPYLNMSEELIQMSRVYADPLWKRNPLILVEDNSLPKLTYKHWKHC